MLRDSRLASREVFREWRGYHRRRLTVTDRRFGSVDQDGFTSERVLEGARAREMIASPESVEYPRAFRWYLVPIVLGVVSLMAGASLVPRARRSR